MVEGGGGGKFPLMTQGVERNSTDYPGEPDTTLYTAAVWQVVIIQGNSEAFLSGNCLVSIRRLRADTRVYTSLLTIRKSNHSQSAVQCYLQSDILYSFLVSSSSCSKEYNSDINMSGKALEK